MVSTACAEAPPASAAVMVQLPAEGTELGAVKTHDVVPVHVLGKVPHVAVQLTGAFAVNCCVCDATVVVVVGVIANAPMVTMAVVESAAGVVSVAVIVAVPRPEPAVKLHDIVFVQRVCKIPSPVTRQFTGALAVRVWVCPAATLGALGVIARGTKEIEADPVAPEPSVAVAVTVPDPG